jgi:hypothetical protein
VINSIGPAGAGFARIAFFASGWTIAGIVLDAQINLSREGYQS